MAQGKREKVSWFERMGESEGGENGWMDGEDRLLVS